MESLSWASLWALLTSDDVLPQHAPLHAGFMLVSLLALPHGCCHGNNLLPMHQGGQRPLFSSLLSSFQPWDGL